MIPLFLHGGGEHPQADRLMFGSLIQSAKAHETGKIALVMASDDASEMETWCSNYIKQFVGAGALAVNMVSLFLSEDRPITLRMIEAVKPSAVFVCGGTTPLYQQVLCSDPSWVNYLHESNAAYSGTSAGAAVAADQAIVGGWRVTHNNKLRQMVYEGASEKLDLLTVRDGLNLVPFSVDIHASQWGTLTRLIHAVESGAVTQGCGVDENTLICKTTDGRYEVGGIGHVYHVTRAGRGVQVALYRDGDVIPVE